MYRGAAGWGEDQGMAALPTPTPGLAAGGGAVRHQAPAPGTTAVWAKLAPNLAAQLRPCPRRRCSTPLPATAGARCGAGAPCPGCSGAPGFGRPGVRAPPGACGATSRLRVRGAAPACRASCVPTAAHPSLSTAQFVPAHPNSSTSQFVPAHPSFGSSQSQRIPVCSSTSRFVPAHPSVATPRLLVQFWRIPGSAAPRPWPLGGGGRWGAGGADPQCPSWGIEAGWGWASAGSGGGGWQCMCVCVGGGGGGGGGVPLTLGSGGWGGEWGMPGPAPCVPPPPPHPMVAPPCLELVLVLFGEKKAPSRGLPLWVPGGGRGAEVPSHSPLPPPPGPMGHGCWGGSGGCPDWSGVGEEGVSILPEHVGGGCLCVPPPPPPARRTEPPTGTTGVYRGGGQLCNWGGGAPKGAPLAPPDRAQ
ncbi:translation initiation factor IF-2-like isoform X2 [Cygnus olor]|uniref:translation initiation factor IF-2-like isoform X2 n=1 Tax=Cygnus olor TaxID=8869 RepID=UPI001ADE0858|nr:translation initiation factor IF-2-like isoform X2 [Cygnus olor]